MHSMAHEYQIKERLGVPRKLPADFRLPFQQINVAAVNDRPLYARVAINARLPGIVHRTTVECPACRKRMSMGRLNQHYPCRAVEHVG